MRNVFLSSTVYDLVDLRSTVPQVVETLGLKTLASDRADFPVTPGIHSYRACLAALEIADIFVLIVAGRFGGSYSKYGAEVTSITMEEYEVAVNRRLPMIILVREQVWDERQHVKRNRTMKLTFADRPEIHSFLDRITTARRDNWIFQFRTAEELNGILAMRLEMLLAEPKLRAKCVAELQAVWKQGGLTERKIRGLRRVLNRYEAAEFTQDRTATLFYISMLTRLDYLTPDREENQLINNIVNIGSEPVAFELYDLSGLQEPPLSIPVRGTEKELGSQIKKPLRFEQVVSPTGSSLCTRLKVYFTPIKPSKQRLLTVAYGWPGPAASKEPHFHTITVDCLCVRAGIEIMFPSKYRVRGLQVISGVDGPIERSFRSTIRAGRRGIKILHAWVDYPYFDERLDFRWVFI